MSVLWRFAAVCGVSRRLAVFRQTRIFAPKWSRQRARRSHYISVVRLRERYLYLFHEKLECGPMPNMMVALPNMGGAICSTPQSLADAHY